MYTPLQLSLFSVGLVVEIGAAQTEIVLGKSRQETGTPAAQPGFMRDCSTPGGDTQPHLQGQHQAVLSSIQGQQQGNTFKEDIGRVDNKIESGVNVKTEESANEDRQIGLYEGLAKNTKERKELNEQNEMEVQKTEKTIENDHPEQIVRETDEKNDKINPDKKETNKEIIIKVDEKETEEGKIFQEINSEEKEVEIMVKDDKIESVGVKELKVMLETEQEDKKNRNMNGQENLFKERIIKDDAVGKNLIEETHPIKRRNSGETVTEKIENVVTQPVIKFTKQEKIETQIHDIDDATTDDAVVTNKGPKTDDSEASTSGTDDGSLQLESTDGRPACNPHQNERNSIDINPQIATTTTKPVQNMANNDIIMEHKTTKVYTANDDDTQSKLHDMSLSAHSNIIQHNDLGKTHGIDMLNITNNDKKISNNNKDIFNNDAEISNNGKESFNNDEDIFNNDEENSYNNEEISNNDKKISKNNEEMSNNSVKLSNNDEEISNNNDDSNSSIIEIKPCIILDENEIKYSSDGNTSEDDNDNNSCEMSDDNVSTIYHSGDRPLCDKVDDNNSSDNDNYVKIESGSMERTDDDNVCESTSDISYVQKFNDNDFVRAVCDNQRSDSKSCDKETKPICDKIAKDKSDNQDLEANGGYDGDAEYDNYTIESSGYNNININHESDSEHSNLQDEIETTQILSATRNETLGQVRFIFISSSNLFSLFLLLFL